MSFPPNTYTQPFSRYTLQSGPSQALHLARLSSINGDRLRRLAAPPPPIPHRKDAVCISEVCKPLCSVLEDIAAEMIVDVLPSLDFIYLVGQPASSVEKFDAFRQLSGHPVIVVTTETEYYDRFNSYVSD